MLHISSPEYTTQLIQYEALKFFVRWCMTRGYCATVSPSCYCEQCRKDSSNTQVWHNLWSPSHSFYCTVPLHLHSMSFLPHLCLLQMCISGNVYLLNFHACEATFSIWLMHSLGMICSACLQAASWVTLIGFSLIELISLMRKFVLTVSYATTNFVLCNCCCSCTYIFSMHFVIPTRYMM